MRPVSSDRTLYVLSQLDYKCLQQDRLVGLQKVIMREKIAGRRAIKETHVAMGIRVASHGVGSRLGCVHASWTEHRTRTARVSSSQVGWMLCPRGLVPPDHLLDRTIQPPTSVGIEMWASHAVQSTDPYSTSIPLFPPARLP